MTITSNHNMGRRKTMNIKKKAGTEPIHKKHKANRSTRTHVTKEHNNQDTVNTLIEIEDHKLKRCHLPQIDYQQRCNRCDVWKR